VPVATVAHVSDGLLSVLDLRGVRDLPSGTVPTHLRSTGTSFCYNVGASWPPSAADTRLLKTDVFHGYAEPMRPAAITMCAVFVLAWWCCRFCQKRKVSRCLKPSRRLATCRDQRSNLSAGFPLPAEESPLTSQPHEPMALLSPRFGGPRGSCACGPAEIVTFNLNPAQSSITISGGVLGAPFQDQAQGSRTTSFAGTLKAEVTDTTIQFLAGSTIDARPTAPGRPCQTEWLELRRRTSARVRNPVHHCHAALRNIILDASSPVIPLAAGSFASGSMSSSFRRTAQLLLTTRRRFGAADSEKLETRATNNVTTAATLVDQAEPRR